ncbi:malto-oligosyltrehalose synthase [Gryllotalpicola reticulitermitis]|uniref:Malto-oligosyltrehalose synthase n=1 Tax=Gryllotalpicola reticulitermitis TaxID=1184153 RepID=A0ABV8Q5P5_9MICO
MAPASSYRLQISADFTLTEAARTVPYLHALGVDWIYLSPLLEAAAGSTHGYDVVDATRTDASRGGPAALRALADQAHEAGMGVLVDIVPNHMGVADARANAWWWDVLARGRASEFVDFFDIDWDAGDGRVYLPVLGTAPDELEQLRVDGDELVYYEHRFPIAAGTGDGTPREILGRQHYRLVPWPEGTHKLNYRRFFTVNELAGLRVEDPRVFDASHREILRWHAEGLIDGLRVDHPDGLRDPGAYFARLSAATGGAPIWVEKIIEGDERMPAQWPVEGTTGYDALGDIDRVFVDPAGEAELTRVMDEAEGARLDWAELAASQKRAMAEGALHPEIARIAREAGATAGDDTEDALVELAVALLVYRTYLPFGRQYLDEAAAQASAARPDLTEAIARVVRVLADPAHPAALRFQQTSGMVMAKGVEDTAFYRYPRLTSLNEVGGDPGRFAVPLADFHARQEVRLRELPRSMTTLTTHDTKRSEDTRARIAALAEIPGEWATTFAQLRALVATSDAALDELVWQAIVGAWPASAERLVEYALKAARESGRMTSWTEPDEEFERALTTLARSAVDCTELHDIVEAFTARIAPAGRSNGLGMKLLQLLAPGMPDVYQGTERLDHSLVDPDNRRPVDFGEASDLLARIDGGWRPPVDETGAAKLLVVSRTLRLRRDRPELLRGYESIEALGPQAAHLVAFDRGRVAAFATRLPLGLEATGGWDEETAVELGAGAVDELTGRRFAGRTLLRELFASYPVALMVAE